MLHHTVIKSKNTDYDLACIVARIQSLSSNETKIILINDARIEKSKLYDFELIIGLDIPSMKSLWSNRLFLAHDLLLLKTFYKIQFYQFVTENESVSILEPLVSYFQRCNIVDPQDLEAIYSKLIVTRDDNFTKPLCMYLKLFGQCKNQYSCSSRHHFKKSDFNSKDLLLSQDLKNSKTVKGNYVFFYII